MERLEEITITRKQAMIIHFALEKYGRPYSNIDDEGASVLYEINEIDKIIGYEGNIGYGI